MSFIFDVIDQKPVSSTSRIYQSLLIRENSSNSRNLEYTKSENIFQHSEMFLKVMCYSVAYKNVSVIEFSLELQKFLEHFRLCFNFKR